MTPGEWLTAGQELPRYVVWTLLLTHPAVWGKYAARFARKRLGGD